MACNDIKATLSAYLENQLPAAEKVQVDEHLKVCTACRGFLEDLKKTITSLQGLRELEPPVWLTSKVMASVREEPGRKKGIIQKLFYPLHIKVPVEVFATITIVVTAFYLVRTIEPEMRIAKRPSVGGTSRMLSQEKDRPPIKTEGILRDEAMLESQQFTDGAAMSKDEFRPSMAKKDKKQPAIPKETAALKNKAADLSRPSALEKEQRLVEETEIIARELEPTMGRPSALVEEKAMPMPPYDGSDLRARKKTEKFAYDSVGLSEAVKHRISLAVQVEDIAPARKEIEKIVTQLKGKTLKSALFANKSILILELGPQKLQQLKEKLKLLGEVKEKDVVDALKGDVVITLEIIKKAKLPD